MAEKYSEPLLDLESLIERPKITIDGHPYEIVSPDELSALDTQRLASLGRKLNNLMKQDGEAQAKVVDETLEAIVSIVMAPVPRAVRDTLNDTHKLAVIDVFTMLSHARKAKLAGATIPQILKALVAGLPTKPAATGEKPSPGSSDSTAATPGAG